MNIIFPIKKPLFYAAFFLLVFVSNVTSAQWKVTPYLEYKSTVVNKNNIGFSFLAERSFKRNFNLQSGVKYATSDVGSFFIQGNYIYNLTRSKKLDIGLSNKYIYNRYYRYNIQEFTAIFAGKLQTKYFDFTVGTSNRRYWAIWQNEKPTIERINFIYEFRGRVFENNHKYNLSISASNTDDFLVERVQTIYLKAAGNYKITNTLNLFLEGTFIPAGVFHLAANYYGSIIKCGAEITF